MAGKIIKTLWTHWRTLWKQRNHDVFAKDAATIALAEKKEVTQRRVQIYDQNFKWNQVLNPSCAQIFRHISTPNLGNKELVDDPCTSISSKYHPRTNPSYKRSPFHTYILRSSLVYGSGPRLATSVDRVSQNVRRYPLPDSVAPRELNADNHKHRSNT